MAKAKTSKKSTKAAKKTVSFRACNAVGGGKAKCHVVTFKAKHTRSK